MARQAKASKAKGKPRAKRPTPDEVIDELERYIRVGNFIDVSCEAVGIGRKTFYRWMRKGDQAKSGVHREFCDRIRAAEAQAEIMIFGKMRTASAAAGAKEEARALRWTLERRFGWKEQQRTELVVSGNDEAPPVQAAILTKLPAMTPEQLAALAGNDLDALAHQSRDTDTDDDTDGGEE